MCKTINNEEIRSKFNSVVVCLPKSKGGVYQTSLREIVAANTEDGKKANVSADVTFLTLDTVNKSIANLRAYLNTNALFKNQFGQLVITEKTLNEALARRDEFNKQIQNEVAVTLKNYDTLYDTFKKTMDVYLTEKKVKNKDKVLNSLLARYPSRAEISYAKVDLTVDYFTNENVALADTTIKLIDEQKAEEKVKCYKKMVVNAMLPLYSKLGIMRTAKMSTGEVPARTDTSFRKSMMSLEQDNEIIQSDFLKRLHATLCAVNYQDIDCINILIGNLYREAAEAELAGDLPILEGIDAEDLELLAETAPGLDDLKMICAKEAV